MKETKGPLGWGFLGLGSQLALVTALGSKVVPGNRESLRGSALYMKGGCELPMAPGCLSVLVECLDGWDGMEWMRAMACAGPSAGMLGQAGGRMDRWGSGAGEQ